MATSKKTATKPKTKTATPKRSASAPKAKKRAPTAIAKKSAAPRATNATNATSTANPKRAAAAEKTKKAAPAVKTKEAETTPNAKTPPSAKPKKPVAAAGQTGEGVKIRDWGFRLVILETLHDRGMFKKEFARAEALAADAEEYTVSAPARKILDGIALTPKLLASITSISLDVGHVHHALTSEWDGEDDIFEVKHVKDLASLPNLEEVSVISNIAHGTDLSPIAKLPKLKRFRCTIGGSWAKGLEAFEPLRKRGVSVELSN